jgi:hypothetical protein
MEIPDAELGRFQVACRLPATYALDVFDIMEQLHLGDHAALFYRTKADQLACALPYIAIGLRRNERCVYIAVDNSIPEIAAGLENLGVDVAATQRTGALTICTKEESYLRFGPFEPEMMVDHFHAEADRAVEDGYAGLRAAGEMSWALDLPSAMAGLIQYEENLLAHWPKRLTGLCQYDESRFPKHIIDRMISLHSIIVRGGRITRRTELHPSAQTAFSGVFQAA